MKTSRTSRIVSQINCGEMALVLLAVILHSTAAWQNNLPLHLRVARNSRSAPRGTTKTNLQVLWPLPQSSGPFNNDGLGTQLSMSSDDDNDAPKKKAKKKRKVSKTKSTSDDAVTVKASTTQKSNSKKAAAKKKAVEDVIEERPEPVVATTPKSATTVVPATEGNGLILKTTLKEGENEDNVYDGIWYGPRARAPDILDFDLTGGRPGAIIESFEELDKKAQIMRELEENTRKYPPWVAQDYGFFEEELAAEYDNDDPDAIDAATLGQYDITDLEAKFEWEWDPEKDPDPNLVESQQYDDMDRPIRYLKETPKDEEGIEIGFDSFFGPSNPIDERTQIGTKDSYMIDEATRDEDLLTREFFPGDPEVAYNEEVIRYRRSLDIIETYQDEFLPADMPVPRHVAKWYGYPEMIRYPEKNYTNNRYTKLEDLTNFDEMTPHQARVRAVELARANNAEWMPDGVSQAWHLAQRRPYEEVGTLVGTLRKGEADPELVDAIQPALKILGSCVDLLSIENDGTVFRFHYHGLMKNKYGMSCWTETLIRDCGVEVTGVIFETGFRSRDPAYDGGDPYYGFEQSAVFS
ncbi:hypothetical protein IV203_020933 [Nitzschia inconspicua]|uniref:Uncharacterized protein n=1 Tax=Nitzschia inconspicua TaxID=303405 RepID=A0A9K3PCY5_9STRA|nr:hypothetical protein IV203_020933 [Nitzschia inconspicua]